MNYGTLAALVVAIAGLLFLVYGLVVTTRIESTSGQATRPPLQDRSAPPEAPTPPLRDSNVPPATAPAR